jgi:hypothetical protein
MRRFHRSIAIAAALLSAALVVTAAHAQTLPRDLIADPRIPGHWQGTSGAVSASVDLDSIGRLTGSVSGPGMDGCKFVGLIPPALAILNEQGFFVGAGPEVMLNCADATLNVTYVALVEVTPEAFTLRFVSPLDGEKGAFIVRGMTQFDARDGNAGMWQTQNESGWGLSLQLGGTDARIPFVVLFVYSGTAPTWFVMPSGAWTGTTRFDGDLYATTGMDFRNPPFDPSSLTVTKVGTLSMTFTSDNNATLVYQIKDSTGTATTVTKTMQKQQF